MNSKLADFLNSISLAKYLPCFQQNDFDFDALGTLTNEDLKEIGISSLGHRKTILGAIQHRISAADPQKVTAEESGVRNTKPLRIFLSYGHDSSKDLVLRIKNDLQERGHDVWIDESEIKFNDDWRRKITEGIVESNRVLSFLSKHSTRDPGVCLDELAIAIGVKGGNIQTILVESEDEVEVPPSISHIQWLDMHDWNEKHDTEKKEWEVWYQNKLKELIVVVESDESRRFSGEITKLQELLKPTVSDFSADARIRGLLKKKLIGRKWLFDAVEEWRTSTKGDERLFWLMGVPGLGKSAFSAHLAHEYGRGTVIAVQFCDWQKPNESGACQIIRTLAFQIATRLPDYRKILLTLPILNELSDKTAAELFDALLTNPLDTCIKGVRERYLIIIDALDEARKDEKNELVDVLARYAGQLPNWIALVVTSRPEFNVPALFSNLIPFPFDTKSRANSEDILEYLRSELGAKLEDRPDAETLLQQILERSEGVFLYVESFCESIRNRHLSLDRPNEFPQGMGGKFLKDFQRYFPDLEKFCKDVRPALRIILAAREPLPVEILQRLFKWEDEELNDFTIPLASLFPITKENGNETIKPYHKSLFDWLSDKCKAGKYFVSLEEGGKLLSNYCKAEMENDNSNPPEYGRRNGVAHFIAAGEWDSACAVLSSLEFIEARARHGEITALQMDYKRLLECLPDAQPELELERSRQAEVDRWVREITAFSKAWTERRKMSEKAKDLPEPVMPKPPKAVERWSDERIAKEIERIRKTPTQLDKVRAFSQFVATNSSPLAEFSAREGFVAVRAYNSDSAGPVHDAGTKLIKGIKSPMSLRCWKEGDKFNPLPATIRILDGNASPVISVSMSADGKRAISVREDKTVCLWDLESGECLRPLEGHTGCITSMSMSADGRRAI